MNVAEKAPSSCPACGVNVQFTPIKRACSGDCLQAGANSFMDKRTLNAEKPLIHIHATCDTCGFEWLQQVENSEEVKRLW